LYFIVERRFECFGFLVNFEFVSIGGDRFGIQIIASMIVKKVLEAKTTAI